MEIETNLDGGYYPIGEWLSGCSVFIESARKRAGIPNVRLHDLRHTCVTLLLDLGAPPHVVRAIVGHSDIEVTMTIYAHAVLDEQRKALRQLGDRFASGADGSR